MVFPSRLHNLAALPDIMLYRLLDIDILAMLAGPDGDQCMPMIGSGDGDRIDIGLLQQFSDVGKGGYWIAFRGQPGRRFFENSSIHILSLIHI